jgi:hypothetical protein
MMALGRPEGKAWLCMGIYQTDRDTQSNTKPTSIKIPV